MPEFLFDPTFWLSVGQIILIDILLGGDNAVVIALACRKLPEEQRRKGIFWGVAGAIGLRVVLIFFALQLLALPLLKVVGALLLLWIGVKLVTPEDEGGHANVAGSTTLMGAIKTIIVADAVMSLDNVIAVAAAAKGSLVLLVFGLVVSIPLVIVGSQLIMKAIERFPMLVMAGGGLLGYVAGEMAVTDNAVSGWIEAHAHWLHWALPVGCILLVIGVARIVQMRAAARAGGPPA